MELFDFVIPFFLFFQILTTNCQTCTINIKKFPQTDSGSYIEPLIVKERPTPTFHEFLYPDKDGNIHFLNNEEATIFCVSDRGENYLEYSKFNGIWSNLNLILKFYYDLWFILGLYHSIFETYQ